MRVSDHAVIRYMERVLNLDVEGVRQRIADTCRGAETGRAVKAEGHVFIIRDGTVITVSPGYSINSRKAPNGRGLEREAAE